MGLPEPLESLNILAWLVAAMYILEKLVNFLKDIDWLWGKFRPKPSMTDYELRNEVSRLIEEISSFLNERQQSGPLIYRGYSPTDDEAERQRRWEEQTEASMRHSHLTMSSYRSKYLQRIAKAREEFMRRNIIDERFNRNFEHVVNPLGINEILVRLAEMSAKI